MDASLLFQLVLLVTQCFFFFFNDTATTEIYTLSLHDALPISYHAVGSALRADAGRGARGRGGRGSGHVGCRRPRAGDRKSTRLNSSHSQISYAVFCLKKKKNTLQLLVAAGAHYR